MPAPSPRAPHSRLWRACGAARYDRSLSRLSRDLTAHHKRETSPSSAVSPRAQNATNKHAREARERLRLEQAAAYRSVIARDVGRAAVERHSELVGRRPEARRGRDEREVDRLVALERRAEVARAVGA